MPAEALQWEAESSYPTQQSLNRQLSDSMKCGYFLYVDNHPDGPQPGQGNTHRPTQDRMRKSKSRHLHLTCCGMDGWNSPEFMFKINVIKTSEFLYIFIILMIKW